jgi:hypothetical protein
MKTTTKLLFIIPFAAATLFAASQKKSDPLPFFPKMLQDSTEQKSDTLSTYKVTGHSVLPLQGFRWQGPLHSNSNQSFQP